MNTSSIQKLFNRSLIAAATLSIAAWAPAGTAESTMSNKEKSIALISSIESGDKTPIAYINPTQYTQHNQAVGDGLAGFAEALSHLPPGSAKANVVRAMQDGDYVFLHTEYDFFGPKVGFDVFRFENEQVVEHWDNLQEIAPPNASGRTQLDGSTVLVDREKTEENKATVEKFVKAILMDGDMSQIGSFIGPKDEDYLQHNPGVADGLNGLGAAMAGMAEKGLSMVYSKTHKILGEGNFVLAISEGEFLNNHVAFYDLFRLDNGMIVEHWDAIETVLIDADAKNPNGKFGFR